MFCFFLVLNMILHVSDALLLPVSQLQAQQVMTSLIRSRMKYLTQAYYILVLIFLVKTDEKICLNGGF